MNNNEIEKQTTDSSIFRKENSDIQANKFSLKFYLLGKLGNFFIAKKEEANTKKNHKTNIKNAQNLKLQLEAKIDNLLKNDLDEVEKVLLSYLESGYKLTKHQSEQVAIKLAVYDPLSFIVFLNAVSISQINFDNVFVSKIFYQLLESGIINENKKVNHLNEDFNKKIEEILLDPKTNDLIYSNWIDDLNELLKISSLHNYQRSESIMNRYNFLKVSKIIYIMRNGYKHLFKSRDMNDLFELARKINKHSDSIDHLYSGAIIKDLRQISDHIMEYAQKACTEELNETKNKIREIYTEEKLDELISKEKNKEVEYKKIKDLPKEAIEIVNKITEQYTLINKKINELSEQDQFDVNNLLEKHVPKIINNYLKLDEDYRKSMIHISGKNSEELMIEGLTNILEKLQEIRELRNQQSLNDLSANTRYTKKI